MTEASHRETAVDRDELAAEGRASTVRWSWRSTRAPVNETRRRSEAEEGRRAAKDALPVEGRSAYLDATPTVCPSLTAMGPVVYWRALIIEENPDICGDTRAAVISIETKKWRSVSITPLSAGIP